MIIIQGMNQFPQPGPPQTVVPGKKRLGSSPVGGLPRPDLHRINITTREKGTIVLPARTFGVGDGPSALPQRQKRMGSVSAETARETCTMGLRGNGAVVTRGATETCPKPCPRNEYARVPSCGASG